MSFALGRLEIDLGRRELKADGVVVPLGVRAFDSLEVLIRSAGRLVTKDEFMGAVWPDARVEANTLQVHISALRKAFGPDRDLLRSVSGRGYRLLGNWNAVHHAEAALSDKHAVPRRDPPIPTNKVIGDPRKLMRLSSERAHNLPARVARSVGRDGAVRAISAQLATGRFVSVTGPGGIGKTTVAIMLGHALLNAFDGAVQFIDLGPVSDPSLVPSAVASILGLAVRAEAPISGITAFLRDRQMLLILDSCEHVVETAAVLAERIYQEAPGIQILTTSREALRVAGEHVHMLLPLECPPEDTVLTATEALTFSAVQLFVERAAAVDNTFRLTDADAPVVAKMCRTVDGLALAIEFAAGRAGVFGVQETARLLDSRFHLLWQGRRTALSRHHTLAAALDWSHALLTEAERMVLRRLSIFSGVFVGLEPAVAIAAGDALDGKQVVDAIEGLVAKSLVTSDFTEPMARYRLLDTTRAYAAGKMAAASETEMVARRHAVWFRDFLTIENGAAAERPGFAAGDHIANVRAALEWSFGNGDMELATALAAAAAPLFLRLSLLTECHRWSDRAIAALDQQSRGTRRETELQASLAVSSMFTRGNDESVRTAFERSLAIAEDTGEVERQVQLLALLNILHMRLGDFHAALLYGQRCEAAAARLGDATAIAAATGLVGSDLLELGRNSEALRLLTASLQPATAQKRGSEINLGYNYRGHAMITLATAHWFRGHADQAMELAAETVEETARLGHPTGLCLALLYGATVLMWAREYARAEQYIEPFIDHAQRHSMTPHVASGLGMKAEIAIFRGRVEEGVAALRQSLATLRQDRYAMRLAIFSTSLAEGLALTGRFDDAIITIETAIARAERFGSLLAMPEMLRIKGDIMTLMPGSAPLDAETVLLRSLHLARSQPSLSLELRTAMSLTRLWKRQGRVEEAERMLAPVYGRFTEGFATADLLAANGLLEELGGPHPSAEGPVLGTISRSGASGFPLTTIGL
jgi:predicted ATPase/DNA-binding winged helix-turn-helix (wHTH) protein